MKLRDYHKIKIVEISRGERNGDLEFTLPEDVQLSVHDTVRILAKPVNSTSSPRFTYGQGKIASINGTKVKVHVPRTDKDEIFNFSVEIPPCKKKRSRFAKTVEKMLSSH